MTGINEAPAAADWLVGEVGVWVGRPGADWHRHGAYPFAVQGIHRGEDKLLIGTVHGLWEVSTNPAERWVQLHDETLTEVMSVTRDATGAPVVAGTYGVAVATPDELGVPRWRSLTETRTPNERYTNVLRLAAPDLWLAGTEAGVLVSTDGGAQWQATQLTGTAVRCVEHFAQFWWAGSDDRGLWRSHDGHAWEQVETPTTAVFSIAVAGDTLLLGGFDGIYQRDAGGTWRRSGPQALIRCLVVDGDIWAAGADPGGLWHSSDAGACWRRTGPFQRVAVISGPNRAGGA